MSHNKIKIIGNEIIRLYVEETLSEDQVAKIIGCSQTTVKDYLKKMNIPRRSTSDYKHTSKQNISTTQNLLKGRLAHIGKTLSEEHKNKIRLKEKGISKRGKQYKGGRNKRKDGYIDILCREHPRARGGGYVFEHLLIWEKTHNRRLPEGWIIHHLNGIKDDNRPENLEARKKNEHVNFAEPYKKRIRELETEIFRLKQINLFPIS